jgi:hypothetical protein
VAQLLAQVRCRLSERQLRLFACACCRRVGRWFCDERSWQAVVTSERFADGLASAEELAAARRAALRVCDGSWLVTLAANSVAFDPSPGGSSDPVRHIKTVAAATRSLWVQAGGNDEREEQVQARLLLDIVGYPSPDPRSPGTFGPTGCPGKVLALAQSLYASYNLSNLSRLAEALEECGCTDPALLAHCRAPGGHVRGCWTLDRLLDRS